MSGYQAFLLVGVSIVAVIAGAVAVVSPRAETVPLLEVKERPFEQRVTAEGVLEAVRSTPLSAPPRTQGPAKIAWMVEDGVYVNQGDVVVRFDPMDHERALLEGEVALSTAESKMRQSRAKTESTLNDVERDRRLAEYELDMARNFSNKDPEIFSRMEIIEAGIDEELAGLKLEHAEGRGRIQRQLSASELELFGIERGQAEIRIQQANEALDALEVRAPHDGIVIFLRDWRGNTRQVGDTVYSRQPIAELPALDTMKADIHVLEADAGGLEEGRSAELVVEAAPDRTYEATIKHVDRMPKPKVRGVPVQYFSVTLGLEETDPEVMKPGQRVRATLHLVELERAMVVPRQAVFDRAGKKFVYRRADGDFEEVEVRLGPSSLGSVVLLDGVAPGDSVALRDPAQSHRALVPLDDDAPRDAPTPMP